MVFARLNLTLIFVSFRRQVFFEQGSDQECFLPVKRIDSKRYILLDKESVNELQNPAHFFYNLFLHSLLYKANKK
jgi:hypothetical protein